MSEQYEKLRKPPVSALKKITGGRLSGKTDINPQWRYEAMDDTYGPCGKGWKYDIEKLWTEAGTAGEIVAWAKVQVYTSADCGLTWSAPIPGIGGSLLVEKEKGGLRTNDEAYKMAVTDALSVALKMIGVAADIYAGLWDGSKYIDRPTTPENKTPPPKNEKAPPASPPPQKAPPQKAPPVDTSAEMEAIGRVLAAMNTMGKPYVSDTEKAEIKKKLKYIPRDSAGLEQIKKLRKEWEGILEQRQADEVILQNPPEEEPEPEQPEIF